MTELLKIHKQLLRYGASRGHGCSLGSPLPPRKGGSCSQVEGLRCGGFFFLLLLPDLLALFLTKRQDRKTLLGGSGSGCDGRPEGVGCRDDW